MQIHLTERDAEEILFALALRSKQAKLSIMQQAEAINIGRNLDKQFTAAFGWAEFDRMSHYRKPIKRVTITCYDFPPTESK